MRRSALWLGALALSLTPACGGDETGEGAQGSGAGSGASSTTGSGGGGGQSSSQSGASTTSGAGGACMPKVTDTSGIGADCVKDDDCLTGYVCQEFIGFMVVVSCQILCAESCECPGGTSCVEVSDKEKTWMQCSPPP